MVAGVKRRRNVSYDPLAKLKNRGSINNSEYVLGQAYGELSYKAGLSGLPKCSSFDRQPGGQHDSDATHRAIQTIRKADQAVGPTAANVLRAVCTEGHSPADWEKTMGFPSERGHGLLFLKDALRLLHEHWEK